MDVRRGDWGKTGGARENRGCWKHTGNGANIISANAGRGKAGKDHDSADDGAEKMWQNAQDKKSRERWRQDRQRGERGRRPRQRRGKGHAQERAVQWRARQKMELKRMVAGAERGDDRDAAVEGGKCYRCEGVLYLVKDLVDRCTVAETRLKESQERCAVAESELQESQDKVAVAEAVVQEACDRCKGVEADLTVVESRLAEMHKAQREWGEQKTVGGCARLVRQQWAVGKSEAKGEDGSWEAYSQEGRGAVLERLRRVLEESRWDARLAGWRGGAGKGTEPAESLEMAVLGVGTFLWEACGRWEERVFEKYDLVDRWGELWKVSAAAGAKGSDVKIDEGPRNFARVDWVREQMSGGQNKRDAKLKKELDIIQRLWWQREVARVETFLVCVRLGGLGWSMTRRWASKEGAGLEMLMKLVEVRAAVRRGEGFAREVPVRCAVSEEMHRAARLGTVAKVHTQHWVRAVGERRETVLYGSDMEWPKSKQVELRNELALCNRVLRVDVGVQVQGGEDRRCEEGPKVVVRVKGDTGLELRALNQKRTVEQMEIMKEREREMEGEIQELEVRLREAMRGWQRAEEKGSELGDGLEEAKARVSELELEVGDWRDGRKGVDGGGRSRVGQKGTDERGEAEAEGNGRKGVTGEDGLGLGRKGANEVGGEGLIDEGESGLQVASWAMVARQTVQIEQAKAVWAVDFVNTVPQFQGGEWVVQALMGAVQGCREVFTVEVWEDEQERWVGLRGCQVGSAKLIRFDYVDPQGRNFVCRVRGDTESGRAGWRQAWLRREMRGLVMRSTGEVVVRGLHKFFNVGQLSENKTRAVERKQVVEVLEKLDGQMVMGVVIGGEVQLWTRKGATVVAKAAMRVMGGLVGDIAGLIRDIVGQGYTPIFEYIGRQSRIKADEGDEGRLVLVAVRDRVSGGYMLHGGMAEWAGQHGVTVVRRMQGLEELSFRDLEARVRQWRGREGVIVRFADGTVVKVKSNWWFRIGFTGVLRQQAREWRLKEVERTQVMRDKYRTREQRLAVTAVGWLRNVLAVFEYFEEAKKVEMVYGGRNLRVIIVGFDCSEQREHAEAVALEDGLLARKAYSNRTAVSDGARVMTFWRSETF